MIRSRLAFTALVATSLAFFSSQSAFAQTPAPSPTPTPATVSTPPPAPPPPAPPAPPPAPPAPVATVVPAAPPSALQLDAAQPGAITFSFGVPSGGAPTVGAGYFLSQNSEVHLDFGLGAQTSPKNHLDYSIEAVYRMYLARRGPLAMFVQPGIFVSRIDVGSSTTIGATGAAGLEYFLLDRFSISASSGLAWLNVSAPKSAKLTTGTSALFGNFYW